MSGCFCGQDLKETTTPTRMICNQTESKSVDNVNEKLTYDVKVSRDCKDVCDIYLYHSY